MKKILDGATATAMIAYKLSQIIPIYPITPSSPMAEFASSQSAKETKRIITVEDHNIIGGLGTAVCDVLSEEYPTKVEKMGVPDCFGRSGKADELLRYYKIDSAAIVNKLMN